MMRRTTPISEINSAGIQAEADKLGITEATFIEEWGERDNHIVIWELVGPDGIPFRVAETNGDPIWEEADVAEFAELLASIRPHGRAAAQLTTLRESIRMTREQLADVLAVDRSTIWRWESGATPVPAAVPLALLWIRHCEHGLRP